MSDNLVDTIKQMRSAGHGAGRVESRQGFEGRETSSYRTPAEINHLWDAVEKIARHVSEQSVS